MDNILSTLLNKAITEKVFPGAVAALSIGRGSARQRFFSCAGNKDKRFPDDKIKQKTFFDLASLTKPLSTTLITYSLVNEEKMIFTDNVSEFLSNIPVDKHKITVNQLLSHSSGLKDYHPYYKDFKPGQHQENKQRLLQLILTEKLVYKAGTKCNYSDLGFILLGNILEKVTEKPLDQLFNERIAEPLGLEKSIMYQPLDTSRLNKNKFASTEDCPWRKKIMRAEVHDEHCWLMNGVSGHAGLFGTAEAVLTLCEEILDQYKQGGEKLCWAKTLQKGLQKQYSSQTWCLGFDTPSIKGSSGGEYLSPQSVGHLGYTGTSFWIDPEKNLIIVLLSNRVHPSRKNIKIRTFRPYFHNRIIEEMGFVNKKGR